MSKVIVITGAGVGLGRALARRFVADGDSVVLLGRTAAKVEAAAAELGDRAMAVECDVSSPESVRAAFAAIAKRHPKIDVLINNAAFYQPFLIADATDQQILRTINTNLCGPIFCSRSAIPLMGPGGYIINLGSESVELPYPHLLLYQTSKAGLERFSDGLAQELEAQGIRVTLVQAGQMMEDGKVWDVDPAAAMAFAKAAADAGMSFGRRPISHFDSVPQLFRALIDQPADLHALTVKLRGRAPS